MNLNEIVEERELTEPQTEITQEQITKAMSDILFQRMSQSEVELMKAENIQLKQTLADFTNNYNKFEELVKDTIQANNEIVMNNINEQNSLIEQSVMKQHEDLEKKINELKSSNETLNNEIASVMVGLTYKFTEMTEKVDKKLSDSVDKATKSLDGSVVAIRKQTTSFWSFNQSQIALFWSAMLGIIILLAKPMCEVYGVVVPLMVWKILYPAALVPMVAFLIGAIVEKARG